MINAAEMILNIERNWNLTVWELTGPESGWRAQLDALYRAHPVFAIVSGLGDGSWAPVQALCDRERMPCWFPSVRLPPEPQSAGGYGLYFHDGVRLEAAVAAEALERLPQRPARIVQLVGAGAAAQAAAAAFDRDLGATLGRAHDASRQVAVEADRAAALTGLGAGDALVLWLDGRELGRLAGLPPPPGVHIFLSAVMAGADAAALPESWRARVSLLYPYELPQRRWQNMATFEAWLDLHGIERVDEVMQSEVFFAVNYLQFTLSEMLDNVYRDLLLERGQDMLTRHELQRAEEETMLRMQGHPPARAVGAASRPAPGALYGTDPQGPLAQAHTQPLLERRSTTIYPHLGLAIGQHFASKGAYVVDFATLQARTDPGSGAPEWIAPGLVHEDPAPQHTGDTQ